jgi:hypothetical protein
LSGRNDYDIKKRFDVILERLETPWTDKELDQLEILLLEYKDNFKWLALIHRDHFPSKSFSSIRKQAQKIKNKQFDDDKKKPWTDGEMTKLESLLTEYKGEYGWSTTLQSIHFPTKTTRSIFNKARAIKNKQMRKPWSIEEDEKILRGSKLLGSVWTMISQYIYF